MEFNTIKKTVLELSPEEIGCLKQAYLIINNLFVKMTSEGYKAKTSCLNGIESVRKNAAEAAVEEKED